MVQNQAIQSSNARSARQLICIKRWLQKLRGSRPLRHSWFLQWKNKWIFLVIQRCSTLAFGIDMRDPWSFDLINECGYLDNPQFGTILIQHLTNQTRKRIRNKKRRKNWIILSLRNWNWLWNITFLLLSPLDTCKCITIWYLRVLKLLAINAWITIFNCFVN